MNSTNLRNYKHDIAGKFKDISTALASLDENSFDEPENNEIFHAVHEVLLKMVKTSRNTMIENLKQEMVLVVSGKEPNLDLPKLQIEGVTVRYESKNEEVKYFYFENENEGKRASDIAIILSVLPVKKVEKHTEMSKVGSEI